MPPSSSATSDESPVIGLALGGGAARGLAHIGVLEALAAHGIRPAVIAGTSIGALVGATCLAEGDGLATFKAWSCNLQVRDVWRYLGIRLLPGGGFADADNLMHYLRDTFGDFAIESRAPRFAAVATELGSGREIWLQHGPIWDAVRASIALPGILTPVSRQRLTLVDGGLVNPVPVSVCRALGAETVIAVSLNDNLAGRHWRPPTATAGTPPPEHPEHESAAWRHRAAPLIREWLGRREDTPSLAEVLASSINIMQERITRSRLAGEPADVLLRPPLGHIGLLEFHRASEAIDAGHQAVEQALPELRSRLPLR